MPWGYSWYVPFLSLRGADQSQIRRVGLLGTRLPMYLCTDSTSMECTSVSSNNGGREVGEMICLLSALFRLRNSVFYIFTSSLWGIHCCD